MKRFTPSWTVGTKRSCCMGSVAPRGRRTKRIRSVTGGELYFWSFVVALLIFALGAGISLYEGVLHILDPEPIRQAHVNYIVLALAFVFEGGSWLVSYRQFRGASARSSMYEALRRSKDPPSFMVLLEDSAALIGILVAALGIFGAVTFDMPVLDGAASIVIGLVLATVATFPRHREQEPADRRAGGSGSHRVDSAAWPPRVPGVVRVNGALTSHLAPDQIVVSLSLEFEDRLCVPELEERVRDIEQRAACAVPAGDCVVRRTPQTPGAFAEMVDARRR